MAATCGRPLPSRVPALGRSLAHLNSLFLQVASRSPSTTPTLRLCIRPPPSCIFLHSPQQRIHFSTSQQSAHCFATLPTYLRPTARRDRPVFTPSRVRIFSGAIARFHPHVIVNSRRIGHATPFSLRVRRRSYSRVKEAAKTQAAFIYTLPSAAPDPAAPKSHCFQLSSSTCHSRGPFKHATTHHCPTARAGQSIHAIKPACTIAPPTTPLSSARHQQTQAQPV